MLYASETPNVMTPCPNSTESMSTAQANGTAYLLYPEDPRTDLLRRYIYGLLFPAICLFGIVGNVFNLIVLTRRNMRGTAYIYMRGYSAAALLAILLALPFGWRVVVHKDEGHWLDLFPAIYFAHLELSLGNACLGVGVMMLLALTVERYFCVCHPERARPILGSPKRTVLLIPVATFFLYLPTAFRSEVRVCHLLSQNLTIYQRVETELIKNPLFSFYTVILEIIFKVIPILLLASLNLRILIVYRRSCEKRRRMTLCRTTSGEEDHRKYEEEKRLVFLLGSTSILFLVCITPMVALNITLSKEYLNYFPYQIFRAAANVLEVLNYSMTFYIYWRFSEDFRNTLHRTLRPSSNANVKGNLRQPPPTATTTISQPRSF